MQARSASLIFASGLLATAACTTSSQQVLMFRDERVGVCTDGAPCELAGMLTLHAEPGSYNTASIDQVQSGCVPILVSERVLAQNAAWDGKRVRAIGTTLARVGNDPAVTRIQYRDRWLLNGVCGNSPVILYVDRLVRE